MSKIINEFYSLYTMRDIVLSHEYDNGDIRPFYEWHMIDDRKCLVINHHAGTEKTVTLTDYGLERWRINYELYGTEIRV